MSERIPLGANDRCRRTTSFTISGCRPIGRLLTGVISGTSNTGNRPIAICIDVTDLPESDRSQLTLSFDYTTGDAAEKLFVHLWGCVDLDPSQNPEIMNLGAGSGNAWVEVSSEVMEVYNLGRPDGTFTGSAGSASDAAVSGLTGSVGAQAYSNTFDLSTFTTAPDAVTDYDYIVLGFAREVGGTTIAVGLDYQYTSFHRGRPDAARVPAFASGSNDPGGRPGWRRT